MSTTQKQQKPIFFLFHHTQLNASFDRGKKCSCSYTQKVWFFRYLRFSVLLMKFEEYLGVPSSKK